MGPGRPDPGRVDPHLFDRLVKRPANHRGLGTDHITRDADVRDAAFIWLEPWKQHGVEMLSGPCRCQTYALQSQSKAKHNFQGQVKPLIYHRHSTVCLK